MNGFGFDSASQFFGESAFDTNGFSNTEDNGFGFDSSMYNESFGGFSSDDFGSAFSESAFDENGFSSDMMFAEGSIGNSEFMSASEYDDYVGNASPEDKKEITKGIKHDTKGEPMPYQKDPAKRLTRGTNYSGLGAAYQDIRDTIRDPKNGMLRTKKAAKKPLRNLEFSDLTKKGDDFVDALANDTSMQKSVSKHGFNMSETKNKNNGNKKDWWE